MIEKARKLPIRSMDRQEAAIQIGKYIGQCAAAYGARQDVARFVINQATAVIYKHYSFLAPFEILEAYQLWAGDQLDGKVAPMYGGVLTVDQVSGVLKAYKKYRREISSALAVEEAEIAEQARLERKKERWTQKTQDLLAKFQVDLIKARQTSSISSPLQVDLLWYTLADMLDMINWPGDELEAQRAKKPIWRAAKKIADERSGLNSFQSLFHQLAAKRSGSDGDQKTGARKMMAQKLVVFCKVIYNEEYISQADFDSYEDVPEHLYLAFSLNGLMGFDKNVAVASLREAYRVIFTCEYEDASTEIEDDLRVSSRPALKSAFCKLYVYNMLFNNHSIY